MIGRKFFLGNRLWDLLLLRVGQFPFQVSCKRCLIPRRSYKGRNMSSLPVHCWGHVQGCAVGQCEQGPPFCAHCSSVLLVLME